MHHVPHFINGKTVSRHDNIRPVLDPSSGSTVASVSMADTSLLNDAVIAAKEAFPAWSGTPAPKRARILFQLCQQLESHRQELAELISREHGKLISDALASVDRGIEVVRFACGIPDHLLGHFSADIANGTDNYSIRQPLGICAGITPFNFPAMIALWMFPLAIACGNTFILKPSEKDPSCAVRLAELALAAGVPAGVVNVLQGEADLVNSMLQHPDIRAISFVGSSAVAQHVYQTATQAGKRVQAFGGAKNHCLVLPDTDPDKTADTIVGAAFGSAGERCMAISVAVLVGNTTFADTMVDKIAQRVRALRIGPCDQPDLDMGPLISAAHRDKILHLIETGLQEGASLVVDGRSVRQHDKGFYLGGCLFDHVTPGMTLWQEEIFGPVLCLMRAPDFLTGLQWINRHTYGNGSAIFTRDPALARQFAMTVETGMVGINIPIPVPVASHSFGGWKQSRFGDLHLFGKEGVQFYTQLKTIMQRWPEEPAASAFTLPTHG